MENPSILKCAHCAWSHQDLVLVCAQCGQPLETILSLDPFTLFGLVPTVHVSLKEIKSAYLIAQKALHPDHHVLKPDVFPFATKVSAHVNAAMRTLQCPFLRACAVIKAHAMVVNLDAFRLDGDVLDDLLALHEEAVSGDAMQREEAAAKMRSMEQRAFWGVDDAVKEKSVPDAEQHAAVLSYIVRIRKDMKKFAYANY